MNAPTSLVGRNAELGRIAAAFTRAREGSGGTILLDGEAGIGKSRLAREAAESSDGSVLSAAAVDGSPPYGPIAEALRTWTRLGHDSFPADAPLRPHLALLLPELGDPAESSDKATIFEAVRCALAYISEKGPAILLLDDLQWSDETTLELLAALAPHLDEMPVLAILAYRSDGLARDHRLRWLRNELRRGGLLDEISLEPLDRDRVAGLLAGLLGESPSPALVATVHDRTMGSPFFVEELVTALRVRGALQGGERGVELADQEDVPVPDSIREAVLIGLSHLSDPAREAAEITAIAGPQVDLRAIEDLVDSEGLAELLRAGLLEETAPGTATFRHALAQEALYAEASWTRRRQTHRGLAETLESAGAPSSEVAAHWLGAGETARARPALSRAIAESEELHAHRDAVRAARLALELWQDDEAEDLRLETLERYGRCAQLAGELGEAAKAWREAAARWDRTGDQVGHARAQRQLASVLELSGERDSAFAARRMAAEAFAEAGEVTEASVVHLAMADHRHRGAHYSEALELTELAACEAEAAGRIDIGARALGLRGVVEAKGGDSDRGLRSVNRALAIALEHELTPVAAELYQRMSMVLYDGADYRQAEEALDTALDLCRADGEAGTELACVTCLVYVLRERGEWRRAGELGRELIEAGRAVWVAEGLLGAIQAFQGKLSSARRMLTSARATAASVGHYNMYMDSTTGLAHVAAAEGHDDEATGYCRELLGRWEKSEDHHYAVWGIRWSASHMARLGDREGANACAEALGRMASEGGHADALAALAQAIGELALLEGDEGAAAEHFSRAVELHRSLAIPFERVQIELRAGSVLAAAGEREAGLERLYDAYRTASKLGARPLAAAAAREVADLGESVAQRLGKRAAAASSDEVALTRRELEVLRHVSVGKTNREIAQELFLSQRTVDMHVRNLLGKLECRSRVEASHRAGELGLLN
ncbi:MAG TPA: AAA family ATPase [Solirubrobacterales bacterium]|nr:AAA family ATPase [Solirubrobacterales bacterium]